MADVQKENGYTPIANEILEVMARVKLSPTQYRLIFVIWRNTYGYHRKQHELSLSFLGNATGLDQRNIQKELSKLEEKNIVRQIIKNGTPRKVAFVKNYDCWKVTFGGINKSKSTFVNSNIVETNKATFGEINKATFGETNKQEIKSKEKYKDNIPYVEIVNYLNEKANKKFKPSTGKTRQLIKARWKEGHRLEDFKKVIDICIEKWTGETFSNGYPGEKYLQPSTLFNEKFDERLNWTLQGQLKKQFDPRDKEIALQQWIAEGNNPEEFNWES